VARVGVCALLLVMLALPLAATDRYVSTAGNDLNPGTLASPFKTIAKAFSVRLPADRIIVRAGSYALPAGAKAIVPVMLYVYPGEAATFVEVSGYSYNVTSSIVTWTDAPPDISPGFDVRITLRPGGPITRAQWIYRGTATGLAYCYVDKGTKVEVVK